MSRGTSNLAPYPILLRVPYLVESDAPLPVRAVKQPAPEMPNYLDPSSPPPVRTPRHVPARPEAEETCLTEAPPVPPMAVKPQRPAKPTPYPRRAEPTRSREPTTHGKLVAVLLLMVIVGLSIHWHWASLKSMEVNSLLHQLQGEATEMLVVPAEGAPMLVAPEPEPAAPPPPVPVLDETAPAGPSRSTSERRTCPEPTEACVPTRTLAAKPTSEAKPAETEPPKPTESTPAAPHVEPVPATIPEPSFDTPFPGMPMEPTVPNASAESANDAPPVEAEFGPDILPIEEEVTP